MLLLQEDRRLCDDALITSGVPHSLVPLYPANTKKHGSLRCYACHMRHVEEPWLLSKWLVKTGGKRRKISSRNAVVYLDASAASTSCSECDEQASDS